MDFQKQDVAYYISANRIWSGHLIKITEPGEAEAEQGAQTLYEFGHGFSTTQVFETYEKAEDFLNEN